MVGLFVRCPDPRKQPHRWQEGGSPYRHANNDGCNHLAGPSHRQPPLSRSRHLRSGFNWTIWRCRCSPCRRAAATATEAYGNIYSAGTTAVGADGSSTWCSSTGGCSGDGTRVFPAVSSKGVAEALASSAGAASAAVPAAAPATGGTVFPTASVGAAARAPASADGTSALTAAPATGGTVPSAASVGGAPASSAVAAASVEISAPEAVLFPRPHQLGGRSGRANRTLERCHRTRQRRRQLQPAVLLPLLRWRRGRRKRSCQQLGPLATAG